MDAAAGITVGAGLGNHRLQVFRADGSYARNIGQKGSGDGQLHRPRSGRVPVDGSGNKEPRHQQTSPSLLAGAAGSTLLGRATPAAASTRRTRRRACLRLHLAQAVLARMVCVAIEKERQQLQVW